MSLEDFVGVCIVIVLMFGYAYASKVLF